MRGPLENDEHDRLPIKPFDTNPVERAYWLLTEEGMRFNPMLN